MIYAVTTDKYNILTPKHQVVITEEILLQVGDKTVSVQEFVKT